MKKILTLIILLLFLFGCYTRNKCEGIKKPNYKKNIKSAVNRR